MKDIYKLELHETEWVCSAIKVTRVPGGWLYFTLTEDSLAFVPFNNEFRAIEKERE